MKRVVIATIMLLCGGLPVQGGEQLNFQIRQSLQLNQQLLQQLIPVSHPTPVVGPVRFELYILAASQKYHLPANLLRALIRVESDYNPRALSKKGCIGLTQLHPETAKDLKVDPWDPRQNIMGGAAYLRQMLDRFGRIDHALWAYNAGPGNVAGNILPAETRRYIPRVLLEWGKQARMRH